MLVLNFNKKIKKKTGGLVFLCFLSHFSEKKKYLAIYR